MRADKIALTEPVRLMIVGYPGTAKTGGLASLANMGYKLRILDYDGNYKPLLQFVKPEFLPNIDIVTLEDPYANAGNKISFKGIPTAFQKGFALMDNWKYKEDDGTEVDLGKSSEWGCDTIVVLDSLTSMGEAGFRRVLSNMNKSWQNVTQQAWQFAMKEQDQFIDRITATSNRHHTIVLSHLKLISPKSTLSSDDQFEKEIKEKMADIIPTRLFPNALGQGLPTTIGGHFPILIEAANKPVGNKIKRVYNVNPRTDLDLKVPLPDLPSELPVETGLADLFKKLAPPLAQCISV